MILGRVIVRGYVLGTETWKAHVGSIKEMVLYALGQSLGIPPKERRKYLDIIPDEEDKEWSFEFDIDARRE